MSIVDLWPDEIESEVKLDGPTIILKEQANLLGKKTKNLVEAEVSSISESYEPPLFRDHFVLYSSTINYRYELFSVIYPLEFFPAYVVWDGFSNQFHTRVDGKPARKVDSRAQLEDELREIFSDVKTVRMIQALKSRSNTK